MPNEIVPGNLVLDQMKQMAYDAMMQSGSAVCIGIDVWAHNCDREPDVSIGIFYYCNRKRKLFKGAKANLKSVAQHIYGRMEL